MIRGQCLVCCTRGCTYHAVQRMEEDIQALLTDVARRF